MLVEILCGGYGCRTKTGIHTVMRGEQCEVSESEARRAQEAGEEPRVESNALTEAIAAGRVSAIANGLPGTLTIPPSRDFEGFYIALIRKRS